MAEGESQAEEELEKLEDLQIFDQLVQEDFTSAEIEDLFNKNTASFRCLAQILISRSSLLRHPLYHFPPLTDPGIDETFNYVEPPPGFDNVGCEQYQRICKELGIVPISRVLRSLPTKTLDLKYYGLTTKQIRAIMQSLAYNDTVTEVILQDNWLRPESIKYISEMLIENNTVQYINLKECRIKPEGIIYLSEGLTNTILLRDLNLSFNSLGDEGLLMLEPALSFNMSIFKLNLSHNGLGDEGAKTLAEIMDINNYIEHLDVSWNGFNTANGIKQKEEKTTRNKELFEALTDNKTVKTLCLMWNGIGTKEAATPIMKYLRKTVRLKHLDISNNRLTGDSLKMIRFGMARNRSLISVKIGNNLITPDEALFVAKVLMTASPIKYLDMENTYVNKDFVPFWRKFTEEGKSVIIGGILSNYILRGPDIIKILFERAKFLAMKAKKKKAQKDFGHFILQLPEESVSKQEFQELIRKFKINKVKKDVNLVNEIMNSFPAKKQKIDVAAMREYYMQLYPHTVLPPPKKKGKGKKGKKEQQPAETPIEGQLPAEGQPPVEVQQPTGQPLEEGQLPAEGQPPAEGETPTEGQRPLEGQTAEDGQPPSPEEQPSTGEAQGESQQTEGQEEQQNHVKGEQEQVANESETVQET